MSTRIAESTRGIHITFDDLGSDEIIQIARKINEFLKKELDEKQFNLRFANY